jgi:carbon monoxide dehydrogenase subunit G
MHLEGTETIPAPREAVWSFLLDAEAVAGCAPGLESLEILSPGEKFRAVAVLGLGSVKTRFTTDVEWLDLEAPRRARMKFHGAASGSAADGSTTMTLSEAANGSTELAWSAEITVVGSIAGLAARLLPGAAKALTADFFAKLARKIGSGQKKKKPRPRR